MRKILENKKSKRVNGTKKARIGTILGIQSNDDTWLKVGDKVRFISSGYEGRILWNNEFCKYQVFLTHSMWYGEDEYDVQSYGKAVDISMDNGCKVDLEFIG